MLHFQNTGVRGVAGGFTGVLSRWDAVQPGLPETIFLRQDFLDRKVFVLWRRFGGSSVVTGHTHPTFTSCIFNWFSMMLSWLFLTFFIWLDYLLHAARCCLRAYRVSDSVSCKFIAWFYSYFTVQQWIEGSTMYMHSSLLKFWLN